MSVYLHKKLWNYNNTTFRLSWKQKWEISLYCWMSALLWLFRKNYIELPVVKIAYLYIIIYVIFDAINFLCVVRWWSVTQTARSCLALPPPVTTIWAELSGAGHVTPCRKVRTGKCQDLNTNKFLFSCKRTRHRFACTSKFLLSGNNGDVAVFEFKNFRGIHAETYNLCSWCAFVLALF